LDCDPGKLASAARLRSETTLPIKRIAARVQIGTAKGAKSVLPHLAQNQDQRKIASALEPCAQLEFQSTVDPFPKTTMPSAWIAEGLNMGSRAHLAWMLQGRGGGRLAAPTDHCLLEI